MVWIWAAACVLLAALFLYGRSEYEKRHFTVDTYEVRSAKLTDPHTFVFLSDLHDNCFGEDQKELLDAIRKVKPDAVLIGGDMMITDASKARVDTGKSLSLIGRLAKEYLVYYGLGNHESRMTWRKGRFGDAGEEYFRALEQAGVKLAAEGKRYLIGRDISVAGLEIPEACYRRMSREVMEPEAIRGQLGAADEKRYQILLAHSPSMFGQYRAWGADLTLAGHYHGGTIRIPVLGGLMTPQFRLFDPCCGGMFEENGQVMIVSRGLGTHSVNIRLNNRAQLVVVKLRPGKA